jgi:hypothetical protein
MDHVVESLECELHDITGANRDADMRAWDPGCASTRLRLQSGFSV